MSAGAEWWAKWRAEFPVTERLVYLDIANKTSPPRCVAAAAREFFESAWQDGGATSYATTAVEEVRGRAARLLGAEAGEIAFVKNTSEGLNVVAHALGLQSGDNVVISDVEHPNLVFAFLNLQARGIEVREARSGDAGVSTDAVLALCDPRTRAVAVSYVTWATGRRLDVAALATACRARGIRLIVDAIQAIGVVQVDVHRLGVDVLVAGAHKGLLAVNGVGVLYCRRDLIPDLRPVFAARASVVPGALRSRMPAFRDDARRFEFGNANYLGIHLLGRALTLIEDVGVARIEDRVRELTEHLIAGLHRVGRSVRTPTAWRDRAGIVTFADADAETSARRLRDAKIVVSARDGALRAAPHFYNTIAELDALLAHLAA